MRNLRLKTSLLFIVILTITSVFTLKENTKTIDFVPIKNSSYRNSNLDKILEIKDVETRKVEGRNFLNKLNKKYSKDQKSNSKIFSLVSSTIFICLICIIIFSI
ncbi:hypothetical protein EQG68_05630 [Flavobacterium piscinae]|uniref:Uncharacterized protein n=1 Tax=Flavobacterium piscinae TaxID=2506424 RepID=A0A4Q1KSM9_9FLAO|nr:hypothetical protein [Flavobacterium piscinae]RXR32972.1 hypothetical protein EQG68_05630 [Flavobacterium piscinae]